MASPISLRQRWRMARSNPSQHRLRLGRRSLQGQAYLLTTVTRQRRRVFDDPAVARLASRSIGMPELWIHSRCLCWVLMPDHWHGLVELNSEARLPQVMQRFKGLLSRQVGRDIDLDGPLWMHGYHDHALRRDEDYRTVARYIIANPVRAGLVSHPCDWPYWDAWFVGGGGRRIAAEAAPTGSPVVGAALKWLGNFKPRNRSVKPPSPQTRRADGSRASSVGAGDCNSWLHSR